MATAVGTANAVTTYNIDCHSIVRRWHRFYVEAQKSQSSGLAQTLPFDVTRFKSYINEMRAYLSHVVSDPLLDCPETGPSEIPLPASPVMVYVENESISDLMQLILIARDEMANSTSSRQPTNLVKFDYARQIDFISKMESLLNFVSVAEPVDLPESSPMDPVSGKGQLGV